MDGVHKSKSKNRSPVSHHTQCKFYKENYGRCMTWGLLLPKTRLDRPLYWIIMVIHIPIVFYTSYLIFEEEFADFTELIHFGILLILSSFGSFFFDIEMLEKIIWFYEEGFNCYEDTIDKDSAKEIKRVKSKILKRKTFRSSFMFYSLNMASASLSILRPAYEWLSGKFDNVTFKHNVNRLLPLSVWYPLDVTSWPVHILMIVVEYYIVFATTCLVLSTIIVYISVSEELCTQIAILKITMKNITLRAKHYGNGVVTKEGLDECLKRCIIHHCKIITWFHMFLKCYTRALFLILMISSYMICLNAFITTMNSDLTISNKLTSAGFLIGEIFYLLVYCWYGEEIQAESADLHFEIYNSDWIDFQVDIKNYLLIIQQRAYYPLKMYGGLISADLNTFRNICNTAYSYFNLLNASQN